MKPDAPRAGTDILDSLRAWRQKMPLMWYGNPRLDSAIAEIERLRASECRSPKYCTETGRCGGCPGAQAVPPQDGAVREALEVFARRADAHTSTGRDDTTVHFRLRDCRKARAALALPRADGGS